MIIAKRHKHILDKLEEAGYVSVAALSKEMDVTMVTVRKDLRILEEKGLLFRTQVSQKNAIAKRATAFLQQDDVIIIGSGTTVLAFAQSIPKTLSITVLTAAMNVSMALLDVPGAEVVQLGGVVRKSSSSVVGHFAENMIKEFACNKLFISVDGIDPEFGLTTSNLLEAHLNSIMIASAQKTIVLADSSKFGKKSFGKVAKLEDIDTLIVDKNLSVHYVEMLEEKGVKVILV